MLSICQYDNVNEISIIWHLRDKNLFAGLHAWGDILLKQVASMRKSGYHRTHDNILQPSIWNYYEILMLVMIAFDDDDDDIIRIMVSCVWPSMKLLCTSKCCHYLPLLHFPPLLPAFIIRNFLLRQILSLAHIWGKMYCSKINIIQFFSKPFLSLMQNFKFFTNAHRK